jgi:hypothetical protein
VNNGKYKEGMMINKKRNLKQLAELMIENHDRLLEFVGIHLIDGKPNRFWAGLDTLNYYLESKDDCYIVSSSKVSNIFSSLITFEELKRRSKEGDEEIKKLVRFEGEEFSLVELMVEDETSSLQYIAYLKSSKMRIWYPLGKDDIYVEISMKAYRKKGGAKELYKALEEFMSSFFRKG